LDQDGADFDPFARHEQRQQFESRGGRRAEVKVYRRSVA
jgi:hypothetical protein